MDTATVDPEQIQGWVDTFHKEGYLFLEGVLPAAWCAELRADLDRALKGRTRGSHPKLQKWPRMFERSQANLRLFDHEPIVSFAEALVATDCHVIHNNAFRVPPGGGITGWHQDDALQYVVTEGELPTNVHLPVLLFTANYYLTDVTEVAHGPTAVVPRSHLFGASAPATLEGTPWEHEVKNNLGPAGSVVMFNPQTWHRGAPNTSDRMRYITQVTYARRLIGHKHYPFMNYKMPKRVYKHADARLRRLLGFHEHGAYG